MVASAIVAMPAIADEFRARLGRVPVDSRTQASIAGIGHAVAELDGDRLVIEGDFSGLLGAATAADLHMGKALGVRGPGIHALELTKGTDGKLSGTVRLSRAEIEALRAGRLYIQVDSETAPDGNLWGWLLDK